jgi:hypothetical protein
VNASRAPLAAPSAELRVSILHVPDCALIDRVREEVEVALERVGATAIMEETEGEYRSPTLLIDGVELDGYRLESEPACRIKLPNSDEVTAAILAALARRSDGVGPNGDSE